MRLLFPSVELALSPPQNKVRITREHASRPPPSPRLFRSFFSITPHLPGKIMPVHISPTLSARQVALDPRPPRFLSHAVREEKEEERGWTVAPKACQSTCPTLTSLSELKRTLPTRRSHFAPHRLPKPTSTPPLSCPSLFADISAVCHLSQARMKRSCWQTDAHIHTPTDDKNIYRMPQNCFFFHKDSSITYIEKKFWLNREKKLNKNGK